MSWQALSVRQPWLWGIFHAGKLLENRSWELAHPGRKYFKPGRYLLHASSTCTKKEYAAGCTFMEERCAVREVPPLIDLPRGCIVGAVTFVRWVEQDASPWFIGPAALVMEKPVLLPEPVPCKGQQGFFRVPPQVEAEIRRLAA